MAGKSFFGRIMGRNQSETQAAVPMSQVNSAPRDDKTYEFNTRLGSSYLNVVNYGMVKASADTVKYDLDMDKISDLIDSLCDMSKIVNGTSNTAR